MPSGPHTPWPNRTETATRLLKGFMKALVQEIEKIEVTTSQLMRKTAAIKNTQISFNGKPPLELAFGRKPRDLLDLATMDPQQLTNRPRAADKDNEELQKLTMKTHLEIQQREDIRRDLAETMWFATPDLVPGEKAYYWQDDSSKIKIGRKSGSWIRTTIVAISGSMATINNGTSVLQVNVTRLRRPLEEIYFEGLSDSREQSEIAVLYQSHIHVVMDILELLSESTLLSTTCASRGSRTGAPVDLRRREQTVELRENIKHTIEFQKHIVTIIESNMPWTWMKSKEKKDNIMEWAYPLAR